MRWLVVLLVMGGCKPTSLLELSIFVNSDGLSQMSPPALLYVDYGPGQVARALSLCDWQDGEFRQGTLEPVEFPACPDTVTIRGVLAPVPEGNSCNEGNLLFLGLPPEDTWIVTGTVEAFATEDCSIIETQTLQIGGPVEP